MALDRLQNVPPRPGGDVEDSHRLAALAGQFDGPVEHGEHMDLPLPDAAPAGRVEVHAVDQATERRDALAGIAVDVVERFAGVETGPPADLDAAAEPPERPQAKALQREREPLRRE